MEIWKSINNYDGIYEVSNLGSVRRIKYDDANLSKHGLNKMLKPRIDKDGYLKVTLSKNGKPKQFFSHRLVAIAFIENKLSKKEVNHINGDKKDNRLENLEWVTQSENRQHCLKYLNPKLKNNKSSKKVYQYDLDYNLINIYPSAKQAMRDTKFSQGHISEVCRGEMKKYKNYIWSYSKINNV